MLVDEFDAAINDLEDTTNSDQNDAVLVRFFSAIKEQQAQGGRVYITGVSTTAMKKITIGINNAKNISLLPNYVDMCRLQEDMQGVKQKF